MEAEESHSTVTTKKGATEQEQMGATSTETTAAPKQPPPSIQLDDNAKPDNKDQPAAEKRDADEKSFGQLRTPKHANKTVGGSGSRDEASPTGRGFSRDDDQPKTSNPNTTDRQQQQQSYPTQEKAHHTTASGQEYYGEGYNQYRGQPQQDPNAASYYAARMRMMHQQPPGTGAPQTISPGGTVPSGMPPAYRTAATGYSAAAYAMQTGRYQQEGYRQGDFAGYRGQQGVQYAGYQDSRYAYGDGSRHPQYGQGVPPSYQTSGQQRTPHGHYDPRFAAQAQQGNVAGFTRAVSSSFDRSTKSVDNFTSRSGMTPPQGQGGKMDQSTTMSHHTFYPHEPTQTLPDASIPDDHSWGALNQVASVDDSTLARARIAQQLGQHPDQEDKTIPGSADDKEIRQPPSNSSSLTNSPVEGNDTAGNAKPNPSPSKMAPLDSLSSVASAQEPMDTTASKDGKDPKAAAGGPSSPSSSNGSLDLMKCHSGSSGLLAGFSGTGTHGRSMSSSSFLLDSKRSRDLGEGVRVVDGPPPKRNKTSNNTEDDKAKGAKREGKSPSSVEGSPPKRAASAQQAGQASSLRVQDRVTTAVDRTSMSPAYMGYPSLDRAPSYTYSIDSVPSKEYTYPPLPPRPGSSSSSTVGPAGGTGMQIDGPAASTDVGNRDSLVGTLPSWDMIHAQDSFGAGSVGAGGAPIMGNFSFSQDYPMLSGSMSNLGSSSALNPAQAQANQQGAQQEGHHHGPPTSLAESRNQSFEGGHYHGGDMNYTAGGNQKGPGTAQYLQEGYKQQQYPVPPQAPSWGTASSSNSTQPTQPGASYQQQHAAQLAQYRTSSRQFPAGTMLRNYSEDNAARTSPPAGGAASSFQPPSDFVAPRHPQLRRPPPQAVYIMSSDGRSKNSDPSLVAKSNAGGVYGWTKAEDDALTEVMKKFKNPRDWEPIAKEHGFGKSSKECHERWIRYLKPGVRKGQWTDHEDAIVVEAVSSSTEQPFTRWSDLAQKLPGRVGKQIRDRWVNHLNPNINHMPFSKEDVSPAGVARIRVIAS